MPVVNHLSYFPCNFIRLQKHGNNIFLRNTYKWYSRIIVLDPTYISMLCYWGTATRMKLWSAFSAVSIKIIWNIDGLYEVCWIDKDESPLFSMCLIVSYIYYWWNSIYPMDTDDVGSYGNVEQCLCSKIVDGHRSKWNNKLSWINFLLSLHRWKLQCAGSTLKKTIGKRSREARRGDRTREEKKGAEVETGNA